MAKLGSRWNVERSLHRIFGQVLEIYRIRAGLTQTEIAARSGVAQATLSRMERGRMFAFHHIVSLAKAYGVEWIDICQTVYETEAMYKRGRENARDRTVS